MKIKVVFIILPIVLLLCIGIFVYYGIVNKKQNSLAIIGEADGSTIIYVNGSNDSTELIFYENDIKLIANNRIVYEIEITNDGKINLLMKNVYTALLFNINGMQFTAKGHQPHSSSINPDVDYDYYFFTDEEGKPLFLHGNFKIITLYRINKAFASPKIEFDIDKIETKERN